MIIIIMHTVYLQKCVISESVYILILQSLFFHLYVTFKPDGTDHHNRKTEKEESVCFF